jgi:2-polyprenyl-6-methoxyphenol hydroxylase-like FAD-dependent oxidoreductase
MLDAAVIIAGGGPCGLVLANELGRRGIATLLLNDRPTTSPHPQANATQARTMEHYRRLGFVRRIRQLGLPADYPTDVTYFTRFTKHEIARFELPAAGRAEDLVKQMSGSWSAAELPHRCSQMYIEKILYDEAQRLRSVDLRFGWKLVDFSASADRVEVEVVNAAGERKKFSAAYLVGCEGPRTEVRRKLGYAMRGEAGKARPFLGGRMHALYFRAPGLYSILPHKKSWQYWAVNCERRGTMAALDGVQEFVFMTQIRPTEDAENISDAEAREMFSLCLGRPCEIELLARSNWTAGLTLVAEKFAQGRVFMAGDAVHLFTPTGGLGYNTAVEDAVNLGWKLAAVVRGWGGPKLLASYEPEREPVARRNTGFARGFADSIGNLVPPANIEDESPAGEAARREVGAALNRHAREEFNIPGITFGARYDGSPIIAGDGTAPPPDAANVYRPTACPGGRAPHAWLADGRSLYDTLGFEFTLLQLRRGADVAPLLAAAASRGVPLAVTENFSEALRDLYEADLALIRPDQIVAWRGNRLPADPASLLARVTGY